jgi:hypothetical protein
MTRYFDTLRGARLPPDHTVRPHLNPQVKSTLLVLASGMVALCIAGLFVSHVL